MKRWLKEFLFEQKCVPWRFRPIITKIKLCLGRGYDAYFFDSPHREIVRKTSVLPIVQSLIQKYCPKKVIDIGCGDGLYLQEFKKYGIEVMGCDNSREGIARCRRKGIKIKKMNITRGKFYLKNKFDLAICFEVAEHIPHTQSTKLIEILSRCSDTVIFTAAQPKQGGDNHINEQPR